MVDSLHHITKMDQTDDMASEAYRESTVTASTKGQQSLAEKTVVSVHVGRIITCNIKSVWLVNGSLSIIQIISLRLAVTECCRLCLCVIDFPIKSGTET